ARRDLLEALLETVEQFLPGGGVGLGRPRGQRRRIGSPCVEPGRGAPSLPDGFQEDEACGDVAITGGWSLRNRPLFLQPPGDPVESLVGQLVGRGAIAAV